MWCGRRSCQVGSRGQPRSSGGSLLHLRRGRLAIRHARRISAALADYSCFVRTRAVSKLVRIGKRHLPRLSRPTNPDLDRPDFLGKRGGLLPMSRGRCAEVVRAGSTMPPRAPGAPLRHAARERQGNALFLNNAGVAGSSSAPVPPLANSKIPAIVSHPLRREARCPNGSSR
jgi:hypothetical protein